MSTDIVIARLDSARHALVEARTIQDTKKVLDIAKAAEIYAKRQQLSEENIAIATALKVEAYRQMGEMLEETERNTGSRYGGSQSEPPAGHGGSQSEPPTLADLGITKKESHIAQRLAKLPAKEFEQVKAGHVAVSKAIETVSAKRRPGGVSAEQQRILEEGRDAFEGVDALAEADATIRRQQDRLELLEAGADDALKQAIRRYEAAEQQRDSLMGRLATATKDRDELERFRAQVMKAVDADTPAEALRTVRAWRALRDEAGA